MFHTSDKSNSQVPNCSLHVYRGSETLIFERKCHSVADLRERSPPPSRRGGGQWPVSSQKKDKFLWVKGRRGIGDCVFYSFYAFNFYCKWRLIIIRSLLLPADVDVFTPPPRGIKWQIPAQFFLLFSGFFMDIYSNFPHCYPVPAPQSTKSTLAPSRPETNGRFTP